MIKRFRSIWLLWLLCLIPVGTAYAVDRLFLAPECPDCNSELTSKLPLFDGTQQGLVRIDANSMEFRARVAGFDNKDGEGVILLHGFPETSIMWQPLIDKLSEAGYRVVAFDQRGYSPGARPEDDKAYTKGKIARDVLAIADAVGFERFHVIGHDFGGAMAWVVADRYPERVMSLTAMSMPHPSALAESLQDLAPQIRLSSYILFYKMPVLPELVLGFDRAAYLRHFRWQDAPPEQIAEYEQVFGEPGALHAALDWYRMFEFRSLDPLGKITPPTLFIWGHRDQAFGRRAAIETANFIDGPYRFHSVNAGHQLMLEVPETVEDDVLDHLANWRRVTEQWNDRIAAMPQDNGSACDQSASPPPCLSIFVAQDGKTLRIRNRCDKPYEGVVRMSCSAWGPDASVEYRFDLGAKSEMAQESTGFSFGDCYYRHRLCGASTAEQHAGPAAMLSQP
ncbi:alpha/beta hydrolase [Methyloligella sp. 2.7D]|uniref:alpha/beta fold hydrolase n=1 Tax=unclassified Methyloligella TaxID=2625955 RepID=UPI00157CF601|nr:alpha/beta hydrolase [Methyloligella sp. GL2]QKP77914.1 alpha/beta hydrolase [Methyloligella sp. GL2]